MSSRGRDGAGDLALDGGGRDATTPSELSANQGGASGAEAQQQGKTHARFKKEQALKAGLVPRPAGRARSGCEWDAQRGQWVSETSGESVVSASVEAGKWHLRNAAALSDVAADAQQLQPPRHNTYRTAGQLAWNTAQDQWIEGLNTLRDRAGALSGGCYSDTVRLKLPHTTVERSFAWKNALKIHARMCMASDANFRANEVARKRKEGRAKQQQQHEEAKASVPSEVVAAVHEAWDRKVILGKRAAIAELHQAKIEADGSTIARAVKVARRERREAGKPSEKAIWNYAALMKWDAHLNRPSKLAAKGEKHCSADYRNNIAQRAAKHLQTVPRETLERLERLRDPLALRSVLKWEAERQRLTPDELAAVRELLESDGSSDPLWQMNLPSLAGGPLADLSAGHTPSMAGCPVGCKGEHCHQREAFLSFRERLCGKCQHIYPGACSRCPFSADAMIHYHSLVRPHSVAYRHKVACGIYGKEWGALRQMHDAVDCRNRSTPCSGRRPFYSPDNVLCSGCSADIVVLLEFARSQVKL